MNNENYIDHSYSPYSIQVMESKNSDSFAQDNFLTQEEFDTLQQIVVNIKKWPEAGQVSKYWGMSYDNHDLGQIVKKIVHDKLTKLIGEYKLGFFCWQEAINPWKIHADLRWQEKDIPYKVILLPLDVESYTNNDNQWADTFSIAFKQRNYIRYSQNTLKKSKGNDQSNWKRPIDHPCTENCIKGHSITRQQHSKYFSHMSYDYLEGLELDSIHLWKPKRAIFWDQNQLHCADNFLANNIKTKRSLILFTNVA